MACIFAHVRRVGIGTTHPQSRLAGGSATARDGAGGVCVGFTAGPQEAGRLSLVQTDRRTRGLR
jgi:hypothetical protein